MTTGKRRFGRVRKLPSGQYQARYRGPDGRDHPAPITFKTKREAERFLSIVESDVMSGRWRSPEQNALSVHVGRAMVRSRFTILEAENALHVPVGFGSADPADLR